MMKTKLKLINKKGFTLIELLVVISIIGLLSVLLFANFQDARGRARDAQRKNDLDQVKTALRMYYNDNQEYPANTAGGAITGFGWGNPFPADGSYIKVLPQDPLGTDYWYEQVTSDSFNLYACLENKSDSSGGVCPGGMTCTSTKCISVSTN